MKTFNLRLLTIAFIGLVFFSCKEEENTLDGEISVNLNSDQNINFTIQGIVYNRIGNVPLSNVRVSVADTTVMTNAEGVYSIPDLTIGSYLLTFEQAGFQTMVTEVGSNTFGSSNVVSSNAIFMYEQSETLSMDFSIFNGQLRVPAANIPVSITLSNPSLGFFENSVQIANTDANGQLTVPNLPNVLINLEVDAIIEEEPYTYNNSGSIRGFNSAGSQLLNQVTNNDFFVIAGNIFDTDGQLVTDFDPTQDITITFNNSINPNYQFLQVDLRNNISFDQVLVDFTISDSTLTISPTDAILSEGTSYDLDLQLQSIAGVTRFNSFVFSTVGDAPGQLDAVMNLGLDESTTIAETTSSVTIEFTEVADASFYEIYANYSEDDQNEFVLINQFFPFDFDGDGLREYSFALSQDGIIDPSGTGFFSPAGATYSIKVRAISSNGSEGGFADLTFVLGDSGS